MPTAKIMLCNLQYKMIVHHCNSPVKITEVCWKAQDVGDWPGSVPGGPGCSSRHSPSWTENPRPLCRSGWGQDWRWRDTPGGLAGSRSGTPSTTETSPHHHRRRQRSSHGWRLPSDRSHTLPHATALATQQQHSTKIHLNGQRLSIAPNDNQSIGYGYH